MATCPGIRRRAGDGCGNRARAQAPSATPRRRARRGRRRRPRDGRGCRALRRGPAARRPHAAAPTTSASMRSHCASVNAAGGSTRRRASGATIASCPASESRNDFMLRLRGAQAGPSAAARNPCFATACLRKAARLSFVSSRSASARQAAAASAAGGGRSAWAASIASGTFRRAGRSRLPADREQAGPVGTRQALQTLPQAPIRAPGAGGGRSRRAGARPQRAATASAATARARPACPR